MPEVWVAMVSRVVTPWDEKIVLRIFSGSRTPILVVTERNASWNGSLVQPEGHPRHDYQHATRNIDLDKVVRELALEQKVYFEATVFPCKKQLS